MSEQMQQTVAVPEQPPAEQPASRPGWERWTQALGVGFVALVVIALVGLLGWGVLFKDDGGSGLTRLNRPAPDFTIKTFSGGTFTLSENLGKPVFVNFWASWCDPCREEAPILQAGWEKYSDRVAFIGVDIQDKREDALKFIDEFNITYPNGPDESGAYYDYGGTGVPESYFIDTEGKIVLKYIGAMNEAQMTAFMEEVLK